jgi:hypothetical protein
LCEDLLYANIQNFLKYISGNNLRFTANEIPANAQSLDIWIRFLTICEDKEPEYRSIGNGIRSIKSALLEKSKVMTRIAAANLAVTNWETSLQPIEVEYTGTGGNKFIGAGRAGKVRSPKGSRAS